MNFGIGWSTVIGSGLLLILFFAVWKLAKAVQKEKNRVSEIDSRKKANKTLNKIKKSGKSATQIYKELLKIKKEANRKRRK